MNNQPFATRLKRGQIRQFTISGSSLFAAALCVIFTSPAMIGGFAYYTIILLLTWNALLALQQFQQIIRPIGRILKHVNHVAGRMREGDFGQIERYSCRGDDPFGCLAAGVDGILESVMTHLAEIDSRLRSQDELVSALPVAVLVLTNDLRVAKIANASGLGDAIQGFRLGELPLESFWGAENVQTLKDMQQRALRSPDPEWNTLTVGDGRSARWFRLCIRRLNEMSTVLTTMNVSDRVEKQSEAPNTSGDIIAAQRSAMRRMASSVALDGKNVFAALSNLLELNRSSSDPVVREQIPLAEEAIRHGTELMNELCGFAGEIRLRLRCVSTDEFEKILRTPAIQALVPKTVTMHVDVVRPGMPQIDLDTDQYWKVFFNIIKNSIEAMTESRGRITIRAVPFEMTKSSAREFRHTDTLRLGKGVLLSIGDDGRGIQSAMLARIFDPYSSSKGEGRGVGLASTLSIIDAHGGAVAVKSSPGCGTTVSIFLAASRNTEEELAMVRKVAPNGELLLVDDDPTILHTTSLVLRVLKIAAHPTSSLADAMPKLMSLRNRLRAVIIDANVAGTSSAQFVQKLKREYPKIPVIVVSGSPKETVDRAFDRVKYDRFLSKPYSVDELRKALDGVFAKR